MEFLDGILYINYWPMSRTAEPGDSVKNLSNNAFDECVNLYGGESNSDLYFNTNTKDIPLRCFYGCKNLHNIHLQGGNVQLDSKAIYDAGFNAFTRSNISYSPQIIVHAGDSYSVSEYYTGTSSYGCSNSAYSASKYESGNLFEVKYSLN